MRLSATFLGFLLIGLTVSAPTSIEDTDTVTVTRLLFPESLAVYTAEHDIVSLVIPLNNLNFNDEDDGGDDGMIVFFVEADIDEKGNRVDQGLYVLKNGVPKKLLDNGRDATATNDDTELVYFAAADGLYTYNAKENTAEKYGSVTDSLIGIAKENGTDVIYVLTEDNQLYKVTEDGNKKTKMDDVKNAQQIVLDFSNNLYFYDETKQPYVISTDGIKKIEGLPENPSFVTLLKPPFILDDSVPFISDNVAYVIYANGTSEKTEFIIQDRPTAYGMEATLIQYFGFEKKIYEFNVLAIVPGVVLEELKIFLSDKKDSIESIATRSRSDLRA